MRIISPAEAIPIWLPFWFLYHRNWSTPDFTEGLEYLRRNPALFDRRHLLSDHNGKQVWHIQLPPEYGGRNVVYKSCSTPKSGRYWFQLSQAAREHRNYQLLYRLGIPAARILAIGESRRLFNLKSFFIVTEFIPGARDGRDFMCGGNLREDAARRRQFWNGTCLISRRSTGAVFCTRPSTRGTSCGGRTPPGKWRFSGSTWRAAGSASPAR